MIFLADLPLPIHGMSNVNLAVLNLAKASIFNTKIINTAPSYAAKTFPGKRWGVLKIVHTFYCYLRLISALIRNNSRVVYRPINGGNGQVYDLVYIGIAKLFGCKLYLHHHSFNYLNKTSSLFKLLNYIAGPQTTHLVLGIQMAQVLQERYKIKSNNIKIISNLAFFNLEPKLKESISSPIVLGHLANLCVEKGVDTVIQVCELLEESEFPFQAQIAGPFIDEETRKTVLSKIEKMPSVSYLGPLYSDDKEAFYKSLDCFIFPSKYKNEAEPLVIYEAAIYGALIAGTQRGCMKNVIDSFNGVSISENDDIVKNIANAIVKEFSSKNESAQNRAIRLSKFKQEQLNSKNSIYSIIEEIKQYELSKT